MRQLSLQLGERLLYSADNFMLHAGVQEIFDQSLAVSSLDAFSATFIEGSSRSGKTHLAVTLAARLAKAGFFPRIVEGKEFLNEIDSRLLTIENREVNPAEERVIVDDAHLLLRELAVGTSGQFVASFEHLRRRSTSVVFLSGVSVNELPCDEHVVSRLKAGHGFCLGPPAAEELGALIEMMAAQRGHRLSRRDNVFLQKRLRRDIRSLEEYLDRAKHLSMVVGKSLRGKVLSDSV